MKMIIEIFGERASLTETGEWISDDDFVTAYLNRKYSPRDVSPSKGNKFQYLARQLEGDSRVKIIQPPPPDDFDYPEDSDL